MATPSTIKPIALYRHYDAQENLLYVGISLSAMARLSRHNKNSGWAKDAVKMTTEWVNSRSEALELEKAAIKLEKPAYNITHNNSDSVAVYHVDHEKMRRMTPSQQAKAAGLKSIKEVSDMTGRPPQTLYNWHKHYPTLFAAVLIGCRVIKDKGNENNKD